MTKNDKNFIKAFVKADDDIESVRKYVKENFGIDTEFDESDRTLKLSCSKAEEALQLVAAKEYITETIGTDFVKVTY